jgi:hypothetical protein
LLVVEIDTKAAAGHRSRISAELSPLSCSDVILLDTVNASFAIAAAAFGLSALGWEDRGDIAGGRHVIA